MSRPTAATLDVVWLRDQSRCFICGTMLKRGWGGYSVHHRMPRGMGGTRNPIVNSAANLLLLCGSGVDGCHGWVETHRDEARELGLLVSRLSASGPEAVPVQRWGRHMMLLSGDGGITTVEGR